MDDFFGYRMSGESDKETVCNLYSNSHTRIAVCVFAGFPVAFWEFMYKIWAIWNNALEWMNMEILFGAVRYNVFFLNMYVYMCGCEHQITVRSSHEQVSLAGWHPKHLLVALALAIFRWAKLVFFKLFAEYRLHCSPARSLALCTL